MNEYKRQWGSTHPGCLIILLDQSGSMSDPFGPGQIGGGKQKADMVAKVLNSLLRELVSTNTVGPEVKPRADIAVLGYGGTAVRSALGKSLQSKEFVSLPELIADPLRIDAVEKTDVDDTGNIVKVPVQIPVWVDPVADGGTPMCEALRQARQLAEKWVATGDHMARCYPPVIINITDGMATDGDPTLLLQELHGVCTNDGTLLLFNCHLTDQSLTAIEFPASEVDLQSLTGDAQKFASQLFQMSSPIPETSLALASQLVPGARGFVYNGQLDAIKQMFVFATVPGQGIDPNR